ETLARLMGVSGAELENLRNAAFLHDIGHMTLAVDGQEPEVPGHEEEGEKIVVGARFSADVSGAVRHHHERWDGQGKPDALAGEAIPRPARILAVAEAYEALTAGRGCERLTPAAALAKLKLGSGTEFDPRVIDALGRSVAEGGLEPALPAVALPAVPYVAPVPVSTPA